MLSVSGLAGVLVCEELAGVLGDLLRRDVGEAGDAGLDGGSCYGCCDLWGDARARAQTHREYQTDTGRDSSLFQQFACRFVADDSGSGGGTDFVVRTARTD